MNQGIDRRRFLAWMSASGVLALAAPELGAQEPDAVSRDAIARAESILGITFTEDERKLMQNGVQEHLENFRKLREIPIPNDVSPALTFSPLLPGRGVPREKERPIRPSRPRASSISMASADLPFLSVIELGALLRAKKISSMELTRLYLDRLKQYNDQLDCVITFTEERALESAESADRELRRGRSRGPLHGIPYGLKDLFAARGYRTTWGATPYREQVFDEDATVVTKLDQAGAVLVAKTTVGALAWGDVWFGGTTKSPWNLEQGSSGSSAGSASATAAGLVGFSIGTETLGSIISPSHRCGTTGLRPTFGRVSRSGGMALSWSMDKVGPICRTVEDCAVVLDAIRGSDGKDGSVIDAPFAWDARRDPRKVRVGYHKSAFDRDENPEREREQAALASLRGLGFDLIPVELPQMPFSDLLFILEAEAAAAFDELTRSNRDDELVRQIEQAWPNVFRAARLIPAVEYIQANRARTRLMEQYEAVFHEVDVYVHPTFGGGTLRATNLTGHPTLIVRNGFNEEDGTPRSICFTGKLFGEADLCLVGKAWQDATGFHRERPPVGS